MGEEGSGRKPNEETIVKRSLPDQVVHYGEELIIPNYSGIKTEALKTDPTDLSAIGGGAETDPVFLALSGAFVLDASANYQTLTDGSNADLLHTHAGMGSEEDPVFLALSGSLDYLKSGDNVSELVNDVPYLTSYTETDPVFLALSGSFITAETDPVFLALSGGFVTDEEDPIFLALSGSMGDTYILNSLSGSWNTHIADSSNPHGENLTQTGITSSGIISGSQFIVTSDDDTSGSAVLRNIIIDTTSGGYTASNYTQGTLLFIYT